MSGSFTPWTVAHQAPLSMGFPRQESGVGCHFLLQIFLTQGSNLHLLHWQADSLPRHHLRSPGLAFQDLLGRTGAVLHLGPISPYFLRKILLCVLNPMPGEWFFQPSWWKQALPRPSVSTGTFTSNPLCGAHSPQGRPTLCDPWAAACQAPLSMGFSRQECWSGLPCPLPRDLPDPGTEPVSLTSPALAGGFFTTSTAGSFTWLHGVSVLGSITPACCFPVVACGLLSSGT